MKVIEPSLDEIASLLGVSIDCFINELVISILNGIKDLFDLQKMLIGGANSVMYVFNDIFFGSTLVDLVVIVFK